MSDQSGSATIFQPWPRLTKRQLEIARHYYEEDLTDDEICAYVYGGAPLNERFIEVRLDDVCTAERTLTFRLGGSAPEVTLRNISFRQLIVESSRVPGTGSTWEKLEPQQRLEICQNESRSLAKPLSQIGVAKDADRLLFASFFDLRSNESQCLVQQNISRLRGAVLRNKEVARECPEELGHTGESTLEFKGR